jgi:flagellum-specific ATP synthase
MTDIVPAVRLESMLSKLGGGPRHKVQGRVTRVVGNIVESSAVEVAVGELCRIDRSGLAPVDAQVVGFHERGIQLMPLTDLGGITPGALVWPMGQAPDVGVGEKLLGRVIDGLGRPLDDFGPLEVTDRYPLNTDPPNPLTREVIDKPLATGVRSIDGLLTLGRGQRVGVFAGSGVGKSLLMGMIARNTSADVNVIALLGERGREVREFIEHDLGREGLKRSVVVVVTSDKAALVRSRGALLATAIAEYFRDRGSDVMLMVDSITRVGMAWREIGLSVGEPPTTKGYPPSIFPKLARLLERAGTSDRGSITGLYTVLVEGDDFNEPLADAARSVLDGHIVLSRRLASERHYPAVDVIESVSRVRDRVVDSGQLAAANSVLRLEASYRSHEDLISVGAYKKGSNQQVDAAITMRNKTLEFLCQEPSEKVAFDETQEGLERLAAEGAALLGGARS